MNSIQNKKIEVIDWGRISYKEAWDKQESLFKSIVDIKLENRKRNEAGLESIETPNYLVICEHPHVFTLGKSGHEEYMLANAEKLNEIDAEFIKINRGGDITYHGPGQLVVYPILDLDNFFTDIHKYLRFLEEIIIETIAEFGINGDRYTGFTGVWIDPEIPQKARKICAMGIRCSRWVTMHGLALNVHSDLNYFNHIIPCGISDKKVASMSSELEREIAIVDVLPPFKKYFAKQFDAVLFER